MNWDTYYYLVVVKLREPLLVLKHAVQMFMMEKFNVEPEYI